jgi:hypothetical protein
MSNNQNQNQNPVNNPRGLTPGDLQRLENEARERMQAGPPTGQPQAAPPSVSAAPTQPPQPYQAPAVQQAPSAAPQTYALSSEAYALTHVANELAELRRVVSFLVAALARPSGT